MAAIDTSRSALVSASIAMQLSHWIHTLHVSLIDWNDARMTRKALNALSDRELDDIGLARCDIDAIAKGR